MRGLRASLRRNREESGARSGTHRHACGEQRVLRFMGHDQRSEARGLAMKGQVDQPNPYGYDEWNEGEDISRQSAQSIAGLVVEVTFPVDAPVGAWCRHLLDGEEKDHIRYLEGRCETPLSSLRRILQSGIVPSLDVLTDITQALRITEQQLLEKPPSSIHEVPYRPAARPTGATPTELESHSERIRRERAQRPDLTGHPRPFGFEGES